MNARVRRIGLRALGMMAVAAVTLSATYATVHAQQLVVRQRVGQPDQLPRGFVDLLLGRTGYSPGVPAYLVGAVGAVGGRLPGAEAFAAEGRVIGSVAWRDRSATAIAVARDVEGARERFETLAQEAGWTPRPAAPERRGFVPARSEDPIAASASPTPVSRSALIAPGPTAATWCSTTGRSAADRCAGRRTRRPAGTTTTCSRRRRSGRPTACP